MKVRFHLLLMAVSLGCAHSAYEEYSSELQPLIRNKTKELMRRDLLGDLETHVYIHDLELHQDIMEELIEEQCTNTTYKLIIKFVSKQHQDFLYSGYMKIFQTIQKKSLDEATLFQLAYQIKDDLYKGNVMTLVHLFPQAIWSLIQAHTVCIKNRMFGEYFYAAGNDFKNDRDRRHVFTWMPHGETGRQGDWKFEHLEGNKFHIFNPLFNEYLYAERDSFNHNSERRRIFSWIPQWNSANTAREWAIEMCGEDVLIKNVYYDEYIYAVNGAYFDDKRRRVFSWIPKYRREDCFKKGNQRTWVLMPC